MKFPNKHPLFALDKEKASSWDVIDVVNSGTKDPAPLTALEGKSPAVILLKLGAALEEELFPSHV